MTVTLHLNPEIEAELLAKAQASGMELEEYLLWVVERAVGSPMPNGERQSAREDAVSRIMEFGEKQRLTMSEPITRKLLHGEHRL